MSTAEPIVQLLGGFAVTRAGVTVEVPGSAHRLLAFLALHEGPVERQYAASCLWMDRKQDRANANLRSVLWRLRRSDPPLVSATPSGLGLAVGVRSDAQAMLGLARNLVDDTHMVDLSRIDRRSLNGDLLPGWYDDLVEIERERFRQLRLHALEAQARRLAAVGQFAAALDAALTAVAAEPLRESAHRTVIEIHLAESNRGEAVRQYQQLSTVLRQQLGITPTTRTTALLYAPDIRPAPPLGTVARLEPVVGQSAVAAGPARVRIAAG